MSLEKIVSNLLAYDFSIGLEQTVVLVATFGGQLEGNMQELSHVSVEIWMSRDVSNRGSKARPRPIADLSQCR